MKIHFFTIVLDGMPWITHHLPIFNSLPDLVEWDWTIVQGVAAPVKDTSWCKHIGARLSMDGTSEYLASIGNHPRVRVHSKPIWVGGKVSMCNLALQTMNDSGLLWEIDSDELWTMDQIVHVNSIMEKPYWDFCRFRCRYFVGHNIVVDHIPGTWTNNASMWDRVWRFSPGMQFKTHEPPELVNQGKRMFLGWEEEALWFQHYAYATEEQVRFKEKYYGYAGAVEGWKRLQKNTVWPVRLTYFFSWVKDGTTARPLYEH